MIYDNKSCPVSVNKNDLVDCFQHIQITFFEPWVLAVRWEWLKGENGRIVGRFTPSSMPIVLPSFQTSPYKNRAIYWTTLIRLLQKWVVDLFQNIQLRNDGWGTMLGFEYKQKWRDSRTSELNFIWSTLHLKAEILRQWDG